MSHLLNHLLNSAANPGQAVEDSLPAQIAKHGRDNATGMAFRDAEACIDWHNFSQDVNRIANQLLYLGIGTGRRVGVLGRNSISYCKVVSGILTSGACFIPMPTMVNEATLSAILQDAEPDLLLLDEEFLPLINIADPACRAVGLNFNHPNIDHIDTWLKNASNIYPDVEIHENDTFCVMYSSGTIAKSRNLLIQWVSLPANFVSPQ